MMTGREELVEVTVWVQMRISWQS